MTAMTLTDVAAHVGYPADEVLRVAGGWPGWMERARSQSDDGRGETAERLRAKAPFAAPDSDRLGILILAELVLLDGPRWQVIVAALDEGQAA